MSDKNASEVIGDLKKLVRTFESLKSLSDSIEVLADKEARLRSLDTKITQYEQLLDSYDDKISAKQDEYASIVAEVDKVKKEHHEYVTANRGEKNELVRNAKEEAIRITNQATSQVTKIEGIITSKKEEVNELQLKISNLVKEYNDLVTAIANEKQKLRDALGV